jgi:hypothetical protein
MGSTQWKVTEMSRKDYVLIAGALKQAIEEAHGPAEKLGARNAACRVAGRIEAANGMFNREKFLAACGVL